LPAIPPVSTISLHHFRRWGAVWVSRVRRRTRRSCGRSCGRRSSACRPGAALPRSVRALRGAHARLRDVPRSGARCLVRAFDRLADCRVARQVCRVAVPDSRTAAFAERRRHRREDAVGGRAEAPRRRTAPMVRWSARASRSWELALGQLTPEQREAFGAEHVAGLPYEEIAQLTGATVASLKCGCTGRMTACETDEEYR